MEGVNEYLIFGAQVYWRTQRRVLDFVSVTTNIITPLLLAPFQTNILGDRLTNCLSPDTGSVLVTDDVLEVSRLLDPATVTNPPAGSGKYQMTGRDKIDLLSS